MIELLELNHEVTPLKIREQISCEIGSIREKIEELFPTKCFVLATCHRITIIGFKIKKEEIIAILQKYDAQLQIAHLLDLKQEVALNHFLAVSAGLHSKTVGEHEILGQIRRAYESSVPLCPELHHLLKVVIHAGKRVRTETFIGRHATSLSSITADKIVEHFPDHRSTRILVLGTGNMAQLVLKRLRYLECKEVAIASKSLSRARELAIQSNHFAISVEEALHNLAKYDVVIGATHTQEPIVTASDVASLQKLRLFIDLGMPRNIDPSLTQMNQVTLLDLENMQKYSEEHQKLRFREVTEVYKILNEEQQNYFNWLSFREYVPQIVALKKELTILKQRVVARIKQGETLENGERSKAIYEIQGKIQSHFSLIISVFKSGINDQRIIDSYKAEILSDLHLCLRPFLGADIVDVVA